MSTPLEESFRECRRLARRTGRNFYFSFLTLPRPLRRDMCALYAFMRVTDDLGDDETKLIPHRAAALRSWRTALDEALAGEATSHAILPALADVQQRHQIPAKHLHAVITGVERDLDLRAFESFDELADYCDLVAGAVGLCCIHVWGFRDPAARDRAIDCGRAFQLTNILRDLGEDARAGRIYLPDEDLRRFDYAREDLGNHVRDGRFRRLMEFQVDRARVFYTKSRELHHLLAPPGRPILKAMLEIYGRLLHEIERRDYDVFTRRIELSTPRKGLIALRCLLRPNQQARELSRSFRR